MSFTELERQALGSIAAGLTDSDPRLASMLTIFSRLAAGEEMPAREKVPVRRRRPAAHRPRRTRRYPRLGWQQAMLLLWVVISAGLVAVALVLNNSGHKACIQSMGTVCPSPSIPQHADASHVMNPPPLAEAFPHRQPTSRGRSGQRAARHHRRAPLGDASRRPGCVPFPEEPGHC